MDRKLRSEICNEVTAAITAALTGTNEVWLNEKQMLEQFQMFSHDWFRRYGNTLPRTRAIVTDKNGKPRQTAWAYARNKIQLMIMNDKIKQLKTDRNEK